MSVLDKLPNALERLQESFTTKKQSGVFKNQALSIPSEAYKLGNKMLELVV